MSRTIKRDHELENKVLKKFRNEINASLKTQPRFRNVLIEKILEYTNNELTVAVVCEMVEISPKSYYAWKKNGKVAEKKFDASLLKEIYEIFIEYGGRAGVKLISNELKNRGFKAADGTIRRYMDELKVKGKDSQVKKFFIELKDEAFSDKDLIKGEWKSEKPDRKWFTDYAQFHTNMGILCIIAIIDTFEYKIAGWGYRLVPSKKFANETLGEYTADVLEKAWLNSTRWSGTIIHTDNGVEFTNKYFQDVVKKYKFRHSRTNASKNIHEKRHHALENRPIEYFWKILRWHTTGAKRNADKSFDHDELIETIRVFIEETYPMMYEQEKIGKLTPFQVAQLEMRRMVDSKRANRAIAECYKSMIMSISKNPDLKMAEYSQEEIEYTGLIYATISREYLLKNGKHLFQDHPEFYPLVRYDGDEKLPGYITNLRQESEQPFFIHRVWKDEEYEKLPKKMKSNIINIKHSDLHISIQKLRDEAVEKVELVVKQNGKQSIKKYKDISRGKREAKNNNKSKEKKEE